MGRLTSSSVIPGLRTWLGQKWLALLFVAAVAQMFVRPALAQDTNLYWDTNGMTAGSGAATGIWGTSDFWNTDPTGGASGTFTATTTASSDVLFSAGADGTGGTITISGAQLANSITFQDNAANTLSGGTSITLGGGTGVTAGISVLSGDNANNTISTAVILNSGSTAETFSNAGTGLLTVGAITGAATTGITQTLTLSAANNGGITLNGIIGDGAGGGNVALLVNSTGSGVVTLGANDTYTGTTTITGGTLQIGAGGTVGTIGTGAIVNNGTLAFSRSDTISLASTNTITGTGALTANAGAGTIGVLGTISQGSVAMTSTYGLSGQTLYGSAYASGINLFANVTTTGNQTYTGTVSIAGAPLNGPANPTTTLTTTGGGSVTITGGVVSGVSGYWSAGTLNINTSTGNGAVSLGGTTLAYGVGNLNINSGTATTTLTGGRYYYDYSIFSSNVALTGSATFQPATQWVRGLQFDGSVTGADTLTVSLGNGSAATSSGTGTSGLVFSPSSAATASVLIAGTSLLTKNGAGTLALSGANTYSGGTTLSTGGLDINNGGTSSSNSAIGTGTFTISGGTVIDNSSSGAITLLTNNAQAWNGSFAFTGTNNLNLGTGTVTAGSLTATINASTLTVGGTVNGTAITVAGAGTLSFTGALNSQLYINGGTVASSGGGTLSQFTLGNSGTAGQTSTFTQSAGTLSIATGGNSFSNANAVGTAIWNMSGGTANGASVNFYGNNTQGGNTTFNWGGGTVNWLNDLFLVAARGSSTMNLNGTTFNVGSMTLGLWTSEAATAVVNLDSGSTLSAGYIGEVNSSGGNPGSEGAVTSTFNFNGGTLSPRANATNFLQYVDTVNVQNGGAIINTAGFNITIPNILAHYAGATTDSLTKQGAGTLILSSANTYGGGTVVTAGTLQLSGSSSTFGHGGLLTVSGGIADLNGVSLSGSAAVGGISDGGSSSGTITSSTGTPTLTDNITVSGSQTYSGILAGSLGLTVNSSGMGVQIITGSSNTYSGATIVTAGTLQIGDGATSNGSLPGNVSVGSSGTLAFSNPTAFSYAGAISGGGAVTKNGAGTLTFSGSNGYTGTTTINAGTIRVTGSLANTAITVNSTGGLGGAGNGTTTGVVNGNVTLSGGSINLVDGSIGTLTLTNGLSVGSSSSLNFEASSSGTDLLAITGGSSFSVSAPTTINITALGGLSTGTYNLITFGSGDATGLNNLSLGSSLVGGRNVSLQPTATSEELVVAGATAYWTGSLGAGQSSWNAGSGTTTNWTFDLGGTTGTTVPNSLTDVYFTATGGGNLSTTLGANFDISSLHFNSNAATSVSITDPTYSLTIEAGGITIDSGSGAHTIGTNGVVVNASQIWANNSGSLFTVTSGISGAATSANTTTLTLAGSGVGGMLLSGAIGDGAAGGNLALVVNTPGAIVTLSGPNTYSGGATVSGGTLSVATISDSSGSSIGPSSGPTNNILTLSGGTLQDTTSGSDTTVRNVAITSNSTIVVSGGSGASLTLTGAVSGSAGLTLGASTTGTLILTGTNSYTTTTISAGTLQIGAGGTTGTLGSGNVTDNTALVFDRTDSYGGTVSNAISGSGGTLTLDAGSLTLTGANTYSGTTTITGGTLQIGAGGTVGTIGTGAIVNNGTLIFSRSDTISLASTNTITGTGALTANAGAGTIGVLGTISQGSVAMTSTYGFSQQVLYGSSYASGINLFANVTTTGNQTYTGVVSIAGAPLNGAANPTTTLTTTGGGSVSITGGVVSGVSGYWSAGTLNINTSAGNGAVSLAGTTLAYGVGNLNINSGTATTTLTGGNYYYDYSVFSSNVALTGNATFQPANQWVRGVQFNGSVTGAHTLTASLGGGAAASSGTGTSGLVFDPSSSATASVAIAGTSGLTMSGAGTLTLTNANTYAGATTVTAGVLDLNGTHSAAANFSVQNSATVNIGVGGMETINTGGQFVIGQDTAGTATVNVSGTLNLASTTESLIGQNFANPTGILHILNGGIVNVTNGSFTLGNAGGYSPQGILTLDPGAAMTLDSTVGFVLGNGGGTGTVNLNGGTLTTARAISDSDGNSSNAFNFNGGTLVLNASIGGNFLNLTNGTLRVQSGGAFINTNGFTGTITQALVHDSSLGATPDGGLTTSGIGMLTLGGTNTYTGATAITAGTLNLTGSIAAASTVGVATAGTLSGTGTVNGNATLTGNGIIDFTTGGNIVGTLGVTGGNWNGAGTVTGVVTSSSGAFTIGTGANLTASAGLSVTGGSIASADSTGTITGSVNYTSPTSSTFNGVIAGSGNTLTMNSASTTLTLGGANTYDSGTTITAGTLRIGNPTALGANTGAVSVASGAALDLSGTTMTGTNALTLSGTGISGGGALTNSSATAGTYAGQVTLGSSGVSIGGAGTIALTATGTIGGSEDNLTLQGAGGSIASILGTAAGSLAVNTTGVWQLSGANTFTGGVTVSSGTLRIGNAGALNSTTPNAVIFSATSGTATLDLNGYNTTVSGLSIASGPASNQIITNSDTSTLGAATLFYAGATPSSFAGTLKDGGSTLALTVSSGALTLTGANSYSGATAVTGGTLRVANTTGSATGPIGLVTVSSGATLSGGGGSTPGIISGSVNILGGGTIAPSGGGSLSPLTPGSIGKLTVGALTLTSNISNASQLDYQYNGSASPSLDLIAVTGALTLPTANNGTPVQFSFYPIGGTSNLTLAVGSGPYYLMTYNSLGAGFTPAALSVNPNDLPGNSEPVFSLGTYNDLDALELNIVTNITSGSASWSSMGSDSGSMDYGTASNWSPAVGVTPVVPNGIGQVATFGTGSQLTVSVNGAYTVGQLNFNGSIPSASYYLTGTGSLTLNNSGSGASVNVSSGGLSPAIATTLVLADASLTTTFNVASGSSLDLSGTINESTPTGQQIVLSGGGVLTMEGSNNFTGGTTIQNGTLVANASGVLGTGSLTFNPGSGNTAALDVNTSMTVNNLSEPSTSLGTAQLNVASSTTLTLNQTASATFAGTLSLGGSAALTLNQGSGNTLTISGAPTLASLSSVLVNSGTLALTNNTNSPATVVGSASVSVASGATLQLAGSQAALSSAVNITTQGNGSAGDGALMVVGTTNQTVGVVSGNTVGSGPVTMYSGNTTVGDGTNAANLTATQILQNTLTIDAGSTVTIAPSGSGIQTEDDVSAATALSAVSSSAVASSAATADSDSSSDPFTAIQAAIASGSISSAKGEQLENRIAEIEQLATTDPGLDVSILEDRVLAMLPPPSVWSSTGPSSSPLGETGSGLLAVDSSTFGSSSDSASGSAAAAFAPSAAFGGSPAAVPEPSTLLLAAFGGIGLALAARRRTIRRNG